MVPRRTWATASGVCVLAALALAGFSSRIVPPPDRVVHVRWAEGLDASARAALERRFDLEAVNRIDPATWRYEVRDASRANLEALVAHPSVDDTHYVDRAAYTLQDDAPAGRRRPAPVAAAWPRLALWLVDAGPPVLLLLAIVAALAARWPEAATWPRLHAALARGIPELSPRGLAAFRVVFGVALAAYIALHPLSREVIPRADQRSDVVVFDVAAIQWLAARPEVVRAGQWVALASAAAFAAGLIPRVTYAVAVAGIVQWLLVYSLQADSHQFGVLFMPLLALLAVPWHQAGAAAAPRSVRYGYAPWLLAFALGVAWLGAAWAKVREGPGWILNGTVRYHFISDSYQAPVDWGLALAAMPEAAVLLSAAAVLIEAGVIAAAFTRSPAVRLGAGLASMAVLAGFYVFQGIVWSAWWLLLLGFLPWERVDAGVAAPQHLPSRAVTRAQLLCIGALACQQLVMSAAFLELPPVASRYDMYSKTHASPEDYIRENPGLDPRMRSILLSGR